MEEQGRAIRGILNGEWRISFFLLAFADCLLPLKCRRSPGRPGQAPSGTCATPAFCLLNLREAGWRGLLAGMAALDKMSPPTGKERTSHVENRTSNAGMSMKTKGRFSTGGREAGMLHKIKVVTRRKRECC
jgi:hypothetical protein